MSWRTSLLQIIALIVVLIVGSFFPIPYLGSVLAEVRLLLVMELSVAVLYLSIMARRQEPQAVPVPHSDEVRYERERGV